MTKSDKKVIDKHDQLLRLHIIEAHFTDELKDVTSSYCVVSVGKLMSSKTDVAKGNKAPLFDSQFSIEYNIKDEDSEIAIQLMDGKGGQTTDDMLGEWKIKLSELKAPKKNHNKIKEKGKDDEKKETKKEKTKKIWANSKPKTAVIKDKNGNKIADIIVRMRRELKLFGTLDVSVLNVELPPLMDKIYVKTQGKCFIKHHETINETPTIESILNPEKKNVEYSWKGFPHTCQFDINDNNDVYDIFIELWQTFNGTDMVMIAETRLPLYDCREKFSGELHLIDPQKVDVGMIEINATMKDKYPSKIEMDDPKESKVNI